MAKSVVPTTGRRWQCFHCRLCKSIFRYYVVHVHSLSSNTTRTAKMKRRASEQIHLLEGDHNLVEITPLGAGQEVGRSCIIVKYQGKSIMMDCGIHPGMSGMNSLPYLDGDEEIDISKVDVALITHFHLDHCAAVPFLLTKTRFKGRILMTHPTKAIYYTLIKDLARGAQGSSDQALYTEEDVDATMERIEVIDFMQTMEVAGIQVTPLRAGHVLGAAMFLVEIAGCKILYTGDYSRVPDRHLPAADIPPVTPEIVIVESTYGVSRHLPTDQREALFLDRILNTLRGGGNVLLPVVALGRAQELLLMLDEFWQTHPEVQACPIYQISGQMSKNMRVFETYVDMMNADIRKAFEHHNPFSFRWVRHMSSAKTFDDIGPCVVMATPSGLQSGASRDIFEAWCSDRKNTVIIVDFAVQGTLAREILGGPSEILTKTGLKKPLRCGVNHISFSAHADYEQTSGFLDTVQPPHVVLVHGEKTEMMRLKSALEKGAAEQEITRNVYTPANMQAVKIQHQPYRTVRLAGRLATKPPHAGSHFQGVLVQPPAPAAGSGAPKPLLLHPDDLPAYTKLHRGRVTQRQVLATNLPWPRLRLALEVVFEGVEGSGHYPVTTLLPQPSQPLLATKPSGQVKAEVKSEQLEGSLQGQGVVAADQKHGEEPIGINKQEQPSDTAAVTGPTAPVNDRMEFDFEKQNGTKEQEVIAQQEGVRVGDMVNVTYKPGNPSAGYEPHLLIEWEGGKVSDMVADAVVAVLLQANAAEAGQSQALKAAETALAAAQGEEATARAECQAVAALLGTQFGPTRVDYESGEVHVQVGGTAAEPASGMHVTVFPADGKVVCMQDVHLKTRIEKAVRRLLEAMRPVPLHT